MSYRGYDLEQKTLLVGWQITITKKGTFVHNGSVTKSLASAIDDAEKYIDRVIAEGDIALLAARP
jgi:hypothetical protein